MITFRISNFFLYALSGPILSIKTDGKNNELVKNKLINKKSQQPFGWEIELGEHYSRNEENEH